MPFSLKWPFFAIFVRHLTCLTKKECKRFYIHIVNNTWIFKSADKSWRSSLKFYFLFPFFAFPFVLFPWSFSWFVFQQWHTTKIVFALIKFLSKIFQFTVYPIFSFIKTCNNIFIKWFKILFSSYQITSLLSETGYWGDLKHVYRIPFTLLSVQAQGGKRHAFCYELHEVKVDLI